MPGSDDSPARVLLDRAGSDGDRTAYEFLDTDGAVRSLTYAELLARASAVAARIARPGGDREPVLLLYPPGPEFVTALWGCLLAGAPAVPAYPPMPGARERGADRLRHVLADLGPARVFAHPALAALLTGEEGAPAVEAVDTAETAAGPPRPLPAADDVALLQYTSGSTGSPKGVVLRHANLSHNTRAIATAFDLGRDTRSLSWLPPYHDMGLIGCVITPLVVGFPMRLMSPLHFLKSPLVWLRQISELGVTATGGPNFAYDLCVRRAGADPLEDLDLGSWRLAFNGAEPVRRETMEAFARRFAPHGFRARSFFPCYGLAEATLIVTGRHWEPSGGPVSCGPAVTGTAVSVVDASGAPVPDGEEGEVWVSGPGISAGYWRAGEAEQPFADLAGQRHLRTGDLGVLRDGELVVTGRIKDVLVHRGENHHAHDLEAAAVQDNPDVRPTAAAFMVDDPEPVVALAVERARADDDDQVVARLRARVLARTGVRLGPVVLCTPRSIPRTTSGKVRRSHARELFLDGALGRRVVRDLAPAPAPGAASDPLARFLAGVYAGVCGVDSCAVDQRLVDIGGDSVRAGEIAAVVEASMTLPVPLEAVLEAQSPRVLAEELLGRWSIDGDDVLRRLRRIAAGEGEVR